MIPKTKKPGTAKKNQEPPKGEIIKYLVLHCSASNYWRHDNIATIDRWHKERGFKGVGYHYFIRSTGQIESGRPLNEDAFLSGEEIGAHCIGINKLSIGVCLHGIDFNDFTNAQFEALKNLIDDLLNKGIKFKIAGHNYFTDKKTCPNFDWQTWVKNNYSKLLP